MEEKIKMDVDRSLLPSKFKKKFDFNKIYRIFFFIIKTKSSLSTSNFTFYIISQILNTKFYVFWT